MTIDKKYQKKYKSLIAAMRELGMTDEEIENKLIEVDELHGWKPITFRELLNMTEEELKKLKSYCWHDGKPRCQTIGISNLKSQNITSIGSPYWKITFSDNDGDPTLHCSDLNQKIHNIGDGTWNYGLYKKN